MAKKLKRNWIGTENNPNAIELCKKRLNKTKNKNI